MAKRRRADYAPLTRVLERSVSRDALVFDIARSVGSAIIEGTLPPGASISSVAVARRFRTSRAPVRDALLILEREGLVETSVGRASRVTRVAFEEIREIYEIRANLHALVSERVVRYASDDQLLALRRLHEELARRAKAGDVDGYFWSNVEFRDTEARLSGNRHLAQLLDSLGLRTLLARHVSLSLPGRLAQSVVDHERLLRAYESRNETLAVAVTRTIVAAGLSAIERAGWAAGPGTSSGDAQPVDRHDGHDRGQRRAAQRRRPGR